MTDPDALEKKPETGSDESTGVVASLAPEPAIRIVVPGKPDVVIRLAALQASLNVGEKSERPKSMGQILKEYMPVLTPLAAVFVSFLAFYYTHQYNARTAAVAASDTLGKLITDAGQKADDRAKRIAAMKIAAYGDQALIAVKMALAEEDLRDEGVLVAKQMYRAETVDHTNLTAEMLRYYDNPVLRLGVVQWMRETGRDLSQVDKSLAISKLRETLGPSGERCMEQEQQISGLTLEAARFLVLWPISDDSRAFVSGMVAHCDVDVRTQLEPLLKGK
jgi:hypothetical protein